MFNPMTLDAKRDFICPFYPAIDDEAMSAEDWKRYHEEWSTGTSWRDMLKIRSGETPTVFSIGPLTAEELNGIIDDTRGAPPRTEDRHWRCFLAGLRDITGWPGKVVKDGNRVDKDWLRQTFVGALRKVALSVGVAVLAYNQITEDEVKNWSGRSKLKSDTAAQPAQRAPSLSAAVVAAADQGSK